MSILKQQKRRAQALLDAFWMAVEGSQNKRTLLLQYAELKIPGASRRRAFPVPMKPGPCFLCREPAAHRHHILQIQHGGPDYRRNIVWLCELHHADIHPWMRVKSLGDDSCFWS